MPEPSCCAVGARPDADAIDDALRRGGPENSYRKIAARHGITLSAVQRHRPHVGEPY